MPFTPGQTRFVFEQSRQPHTMTSRFKKTFFVLTVLFYIPVSLSVSASTLDSWLTAFQGNSQNPICGCKEASCCCGAPCCAPKEDKAAEPSCCGSSEPEQSSPEEIPLSLQYAWKATCTCGGNHADHGAVLADPQNFVQCRDNAFWLPAFSKNSSYVRHWTSLKPTPPEQVPKSFLFS